MGQTDSSTATQIFNVEAPLARHSNRVILQQGSFFGTVQIHVVQAIHIDRID